MDCVAKQVIWSQCGEYVRTAISTPNRAFIPDITDVKQAPSGECMHILSGDWHFAGKMLENKFHLANAWKLNSICFQALLEMNIFNVQASASDVCFQKFDKWFVFTDLRGQLIVCLPYCWLKQDRSPLPENHHTKCEDSQHAQYIFQVFSISILFRSYATLYQFSVDTNTLSPIIFEIFHFWDFDF